MVKSSRSWAGAVWRHRLLTLVVFAIVVLGVGWWLRTAPRAYTASATVTATPVTSLLESTGNIENLEATLAQVANSQSVLQDVTTRLNGRRTVATLRDEVRGTHVTGTILIRVTATDSDARTASDIANIVASVLPAHDPSRGLLQFTQVDPAHPPTTYSSPNTKVVALSGIGLALLLAAASALLHDALAGKVETVDELRASTGTEVLAVLPRPRRLSTSPVASTDGASAAAFRSLRIALPIAAWEKPLRPVVIAGASARRDLSPWLAINLAVAIATVRNQVLLVDASAADPKAFPALRRDESSGLYAVLRDEVKAEDAFMPGPVEGVAVLPAGHSGRGAMIGQLEMRFQKLLSEVEDRFDAVVVAAPPLSDSEDARALASGGFLVLVVARRIMRSAQLRSLVAELESDQVPVSGTVLIR